MENFSFGAFTNIYLFINLFIIEKRNMKQCPKWEIQVDLA